MNNKRPQLPLFVIAFMGHVLALFTLWLVINREDVQEPVFEKVISVRTHSKMHLSLASDKPGSKR